MRSNYLSFDTYRCNKCKVGSLASLENQLEEVICQNCNQKYQYKNNILDTLISPNLEVIQELKGIALENDIDEQQYQKVKIRPVQKIKTFQDKLEQTKNECGQYYQQTLANFRQAFESLDLPSNLKVMEIGSVNDFYFLRPFKNNKNRCIALNIHFEIEGTCENTIWPERVLADMNDLPFFDNTFDVIIISATSHHSSQLNQVISEISRVLKRGGKCLMINDPLWGLIKSLGGKCRASRHKLIHENEYSIWRYNHLFRQHNLKAEHLFSAYYDQILLKRVLRPQTRFYIVAKMLTYFWHFKVFRNLIKKYLLWFAQAFFGFPLNVILTKK